MNRKLLFIPLALFLALAAALVLAADAQCRWRRPDDP